MYKRQLLDGARKQEGKARIWNVDSKGVIVSSSNWFGSGLQLWNWEAKSGVDDLDGDGEIGIPTGPIGGDGVLYYDGQARYQLLASSDPDSFVQLQNSTGKTFSDASSALWDAVYARDVEAGGYEVLLDGAGKKEGKANIWSVGSDGVIDSSSGWFSGTDDFWSWDCLLYTSPSPRD